MSSERCAELRELAPELALGLADGEERARALEHLAACPECRRHVEELAAIADELLVLAPEREPPLGFEGRVLAAVGAGTRPERRRRLRLVPVGATAALAAAVGAVAVFLAYRDDHRLASQYRAALAEANGSYFTAAPLRAPGGREVGQVFGYQGQPSWVLVTVSGSGLRSGRYATQVVSADGARRTVGWVRIRSGRGSYGRAIPMPLERVSEVRLLGPGRTDLEAQLHG